MTLMFTYSCLPSIKFATLNNIWKALNPKNDLAWVTAAAVDAYYVPSLWILDKLARMPIPRNPCLHPSPPHSSLIFFSISWCFCCCHNVRCYFISRKPLHNTRFRGMSHFFPATSLRMRVRETPQYVCVGKISEQVGACHKPV